MSWRLIVRRRKPRTILLLQPFILLGAFRLSLASFRQSSPSRISLPLLSVSTFVRNNKVEVPEQYSQQHGTIVKSFPRRIHTVGMLSSNDAEQDKKSKQQFEIEQKFQILSSDRDNQAMEARLRQLNFKNKGTIRFVDWYFDSEDIALSTRDCWLRFREAENERHEGVWQLKKGTSGGKISASSSTTVYIEIEGKQAISTALAELTQGVPLSSYVAEPMVVGSIGDYIIPELPDDGAKELLAPFCRIVTTRSSWAFMGETNDDAIPSNNNKADVGMDLNPSLVGLTVDLDCTDTGFAVGEVEAVVESESDIPQAKLRIQTLVDKLKTTRGSLEEAENPSNNGGIGDGPAIGKLEHYLMIHRPDHYKACIQSGSIAGKKNN
jgi:thiamine-triphosphatase